MRRVGKEGAVTLLFLAHPEQADGLLLKAVCLHQRGVRRLARGIASRVTQAQGQRRADEQGQQDGQRDGQTEAPAGGRHHGFVRFTQGSYHLLLPLKGHP